MFNYVLKAANLFVNKNVLVLYVSFTERSPAQITHRVATTAFMMEKLSQAGEGGGCMSTKLQRFLNLRYWSTGGGT